MEIVQGRVKKESGLPEKYVMEQGIRSYYRRGNREGKWAVALYSGEQPQFCSHVT